MNYQGPNRDGTSERNVTLDRLHSESRLTISLGCAGLVCSRKTLTGKAKEHMASVGNQLTDTQHCKEYGDVGCVFT